MPIPKKIHYCWFGHGEKPELIKRCIESWKKYCPDCEIIEWNESNYDVTKNTYMYQAYQAKRWGFATDYARLDIICTHGGVYLDTDVELIRNIDMLFAGDGFLGFEHQGGSNADGYLVNTGQGFGAPAGHEVISPNWWAWLLIPVALVHLGVMGLGFGIIISSMTTKYRDLAILVNFGVQLWMYATPIVYPLSQLGDGLMKTILLINPVTAPVELIRFAVLGRGTIVPAYLALSWAITALVAVFGVMLFNHVEKTFMDTV